jgi:sterol desaturase/sphingolipid hydroxylase (fatty acid hydroxylase superfamily)
MELWIDYLFGLFNDLGLNAMVQTNKRIFYPYLLSSTLMAFVYFRLVYLKKQGHKSRSFFQYIFPKSIWWHRSAIIDYQLFFVNNILKILLVAPYLVAHLSAAYMVTSSWEKLLGYQDAVLLDVGYINLLYSIVFILIADFSRFFFHYCFHKIPFLWQFHKVHHTAEVMTPMTLYRVHPFEYICLKMRSVFIFGLVTGSFYFWFRTGLQPVSVLKIHGAIFVFNLLGANLRHSHIPIRFGQRLEKIFISPAQHQIHHSNAPIHYDKNFGSIFALWDRFFGTLEISSAQQNIKFGIEATEQKEYNTLIANIWKPIAALFKNKP